MNNVDGVMWLINAWKAMNMVLFMGSAVFMNIVSVREINVFRIQTAMLAS